MRIGRRREKGEITHRPDGRREVIKIGRGVCALAINKYLKRPEYDIYGVYVCVCPSRGPGRSETDDRLSKAIFAGYDGRLRLRAGGGSAAAEEEP